MDVCRFCLSKSPNKDISQLNTGLENDCNSYHQIVKFCLNIEVDEEMQITRKICKKCFFNVLNFYKFKTLALKTDAYWRCDTSNVLVKNEAPEEVKVSEEPILEEYLEDSECDYNFKYDPLGTADSVQDLKDDHEDEQFYSEDLMNENFTLESGNSSDDDSILEPQFTQDDDDENLGTDEEDDEEMFDDKDDPTYEPPQSYGATPKNTKECVPNAHGEHAKSKQKCLVCNKEVLYLQLHMLRAHQPQMMKYLCKGCGRRFLTQSNRNNHGCPSVNIHCHICSKKLAHSVSLSLHIRRVHKEEKRALCQYCSKTFFAVSSLRKHLRTHTKERPFKCTECDRSFNHKTTLTMHMEAQHLDLKFPCTVCQKVFSSKLYLYRHKIYTHNNKNSFKCGYGGCDITFSRRDNCKMHEKRKHGASLT